MGWNYRLVRRTYPNAAIPEERELYAVHEAYYGHARRVWGITKDAIPARGTSPEEVVKTLEMMLKDIQKAPVLDYDSVPEPGAENPADKVDEGEKDDEA